MVVRKYSRQRELIKACLASRYDHPTADTLYQTIREEYPNISLGTVYRNLALLVSMGEIQKIASADGPDRFDWNVKPHCHFSCRCCGKVIDLDMPDTYANDFLGKAKTLYDGIIETQNIQFYGICDKCKEEDVSFKQES